MKHDPRIKEALDELRAAWDELKFVVQRVMFTNPMGLLWAALVFLIVLWTLLFAVPSIADETGITVLPGGSITMTGNAAIEVDTDDYVLVLSQDPDAWDGRCPICKEQGLRSTVTVGGSYSTLLYCGAGHYDEDGNYHAPTACNSTSTDYTCSNGHSFSQTRRTW